MGRKRSYLEICRDILRAANYGAKPTALVYKANLNFNVIKKYIQDLEASGLLFVEDIHGPGNQTRIYHTTEKGRTFITSLAETMAIFNCPIPPGDGGLIQEAPEV